MTNFDRLRDRLLALCLVAAPALFLIGDLIHPDDDPDPADQLAIVRDNLDSWFLAHLIVLVGTFLMIPALMAVYRWLRGRSPALALWGTGLSVLGVLAVVGIIAADGFMLWQMAQPERDGAQMTALWDSAQSSAALGIFFGLSMGIVLGTLVYAVAFFRSRTAPQWVPIALVVGALATAVSRPIGLKPGVLLADVLLLAVFGWLASRYMADESSPDRESAAAAA